MSTTVILTQKDEIFYEVNSNDLVGNESVYFIFPPTSLYNNAGEVLEEYVSRPDDKIVNKDIAFLKFDEYKDTTQADKGFLGETSFSSGEFAHTNLAGAFHALTTDDYYYKYTGSAGTMTAPNLKRSSSTKPKIAEAIHLPESSIGATFENLSMKMQTANVNRFQDLNVEGLDEGEHPLGQQMFAIRFGEDDIEDVTYRSFDTSTISADVDVTITDANIISAQIRSQSGRGAWPGITNALIKEAENTFVTETATENTDYVSAVEIVNIERTQTDERYGDPGEDYPFILTGNTYVFTDAELVNVAAGSSDPIDGIQVYGGDCIVGKHTFKISDSAYVLTDPEKEADGSGTAGTPEEQTDKWGWYYDRAASGDGSPGVDVSRPFPLRGVSETITVWLESEVNPYGAEKSPHTGWTDAKPYPIVEQPGQIRSKFNYRYNLDYSRENNYKVYFPFKDIDTNRTLYGARLVYSDQKIYQTDQEGFDRFRVGNVFDLDETRGDLMRLEQAKDNVYAFQQKGISYIPILAQSVELTDISTLAIRSGEIIGLPVTISSEMGVQYPKTITSDGERIYFADHRNNQIGRVVGNNIEIISDLGMKTYFKENMDAPTLDAYAIYDRSRNEYIYIDRENISVVFNADLNVWTSLLTETNDTSNRGGLWTNGELYLVAKDGTGDVDIKLWRDKDSTINHSIRFGSVLSGRVSISVNPQPDLPKTFDMIAYNCLRPLSSSTFTVVNPELTSTDSVSLVSFTTRQEGLYKQKELRSSSGGERFRGLHATVQIFFKANESTNNVLSSVLTKYRPSYKQI